MRVGFALPQYDIFADPELIADVSRQLENLGYDSLWVGDRILGPLTPSNPYPAGDGTMPEQFATTFDPLTALTVAATATERVRLGTSTLNALWHSPVMLARTLTALDLVSAGRLDVGIGLGWLEDEYTAAGVAWQDRGARLEETLDVLETIWTRSVVEHHGPLFTIPASKIYPKPVQSPRPPIYLAGFTPAALRRIGRRGDGWVGLAMPLPYVKSLWDVARSEAEAVGRDPDSLYQVMRINPRITQHQGAAEHVHETGTVTQVCDYARAAIEAGADEVFFDVQTTVSSVAELLDNAEALIKELRA
ncbi:TIGR03619 family F420-dependent LLM class oxidoreductase [Streptomyces chartreusis]|uniref:TIGR03619 family F420-dependent LLM class oxidoreductase n=1 Tax=Streptomyces chartreusis TaxID=1969 RepID=UPI0036831AC5